MNRPGLALILTAALAWSGAAPGADIDKRTAILCVFDETRSLTTFGNDMDTRKSSKVRSWFTQWLFSDDSSSRSAKIRFLWIPESASGPRLKIDSKETHHVLVRLMSQTRDSVLAASSASDILTSVGWMFTINFKLEQVMASSVRTNAAGMKSEAVRLSCSFDDETPAIEAPGKGDATG